jgi:hypothetical protein
LLGAVAGIRARSTAEMLGPVLVVAGAAPVGAGAIAAASVPVAAGG